MEKYEFNIFVLSPILCITILLLLIIIISLLPTLELQKTEELAPVMINLMVTVQRTENMHLLFITC